MFNLTDINLSYLVISPENPNNLPSDNRLTCDRLCSILYGKDYTVIPVQSWKNGISEMSFIGINPNDNNSLRKDSIFLLNNFNKKSIIVKYKDDEFPRLISEDGSERLYKLDFYSNNLNEKIYVYNGISFCFEEQIIYFFPTKKEELKRDMIIEFFNNDKWIEKKVDNVDIEYEKMYKLLIKYKKLRICQ